MKLRIKIAAFLMALVMTVPLLAMLPLPASASSQVDGNSTFTKKIVSVVFDDSGSMTGGTNSKFEYAKYAMQMLMALLGENDELIITPMNSGSTITVDLTDPNRNQVISKIMKDPVFSRPTNKGTPAASMDKAINELVKKGLKNADYASTAAENVEHWMVILTDGAFDGTSQDVNLGAKAIKDRISKYPSLKTIYLGFGRDALVFSNTYLAREYQFTGYESQTVDGIIDAMRNVANQLSGRYTLDPSMYTLNGSTVTVDLSQCDFSFKNITAIAQNCDAEIVSAKYNGSAVQISQACRISPNAGISNMKDGYSAVMNGSPYFSGGKLEINFSSPIQPQNLSILAEPALSIVSFLEYFDGSAWKRTNTQYVNANLSQNDKVRVGYEVFENVANREIDLEKVFGAVVSSVTYAGKSYSVGDEIPLVVGTNEIAISVSVMNGAYKMYDSFLCVIETNPDFYRVDAEHDPEISWMTGKSEITYTLYVNNSPVGRSAWSEYKYKAVATAPNGNSAPVKTTELEDGRIKVELETLAGVFGSYNVYFEVTSKYGITREKSVDLKYSSGELELKCEAPGEVSNVTVQPRVKFSVLAKGNKLTKAELASFTVSAVFTDAAGAETAATYSIETDGTIVIVPSISEGTYGRYTVGVNITAAGVAPLEGKHSIDYFPSSVEIKSECPAEFSAGQLTAESKHSVYIDGKKLTKAQLDKYKWSLTAVKPDGSQVNINVNSLDDGTIESKLTIGQTDFGAYKLKLAFELSADKVYEDVKEIKNYPKTVVVTAKGNGKVSASQYGMLTNTLPIEFELTADGVPLIFENGLTSHKLMLGGRDVTQYAEINGSVLSFVPVAEHFGGDAPIGETTLRLELAVDGMPALSSSAEGTVDVYETLYEIVLSDKSRQNVDRFKLRKIDAVLYFKVLRDGKPLPLDELKAAFDSGEITVNDDSGTFGWQIWLPVGRETTVEEIDGEAVIACKVKKDLFPPLDTFAAMLIFNGDKPITATYKDATLTENIKFDKSGVWSYIWRILVILLTIHTILYIIGFFNGKCKSLPSGLVVTANIPAADSSVWLQAEKFNCSFKDKYAWHLLRFIPHKKTLWYHQPEKELGDGNGIVIKMDASGNPVFVLDEEKQVVRFFGNDREESRLVERFRSETRQYHKGSVPEMTKAVSGRTIRSLFNTTGETKRVSQEVSYTGCYGSLRDNKLASLIYFVPILRIR